MKPVRAACSLLALALCGVLAADLSGVRIAAADPIAFTEINWPFLLDQWGTGRAFACQGARCAPQDRLLVRAKSGFCNCGNGVADDDEVDRLTDFDFLGDHVVPQGSGQPITVAGVSGRLRAFAVRTAHGGARHAVAVVLAPTLVSDTLDGQDAAMLTSIGAKMIAALP